MSLVRRLFSPAGFLLVILCFSLPFLTVSCDSPAGSFAVDLTGVNLVAGTEPSRSMTGVFAEGADTTESDAAAAESDPDSGTDDVEPSTVVKALGPASLLMFVLALVLSAVRRSRLWSAAAAVVGAIGGAALIGAVFLLRDQMIDAATDPAEQSELFVVTRDMVASLIHIRYGFWLALSFLAVAIAGLIADMLLKPTTGSAAAGPTYLSAEQLAYLERATAPTPYLSRQVPATDDSVWADDGRGTGSRFEPAGPRQGRHSAPTTRG